MDGGRSGRGPTGRRRIRFLPFPLPQCRPDPRMRPAAACRLFNFPVEGTAVYSWVPGVSWSDRLSFWRSGYPALMITDSGFFPLSPLPFLPGRSGKVGLCACAAVVEGVARMLIRLADDDNL